MKKFAGCSSGTHGRIWCECSLANLCPGATTHLRGDDERSRVVAEPKGPAKHCLLARSAPPKYANWLGINVFLSSSTAYPQDVGTTPSCSQLWLPMLLLTINVTRRRDDSIGFCLLYSI